ncbi:MAG TPA: small multi-drug export protein [Spirochaetota bacterium]|nr:small multi-drug export protein [Spirochaetota bacterium]HPC41210.1 small multi-drug export protein [Spirochaetota bacterium]HQF08178.1 small multi-drug export protein [Spirochaetota bacterium]HQH96935.1 small multi-drug export protein [Spirochaetota bacterium]
MKTAAQIFSVMSLSAVFFWGGFPAALAFKFHLMAAGLITAAGAEAAVLLVLLMGRPIQAYLLRRFPAWLEKTRNGKAGAIFQKYGMPGLGLIAPVMPGAPQAALIGLVLSAKPGMILLWITAGIVLWAVIVTAGLAFGLEFVRVFFER